MRASKVQGETIDTFLVELYDLLEGRQIARAGGCVEGRFVGQRESSLVCG